MGENAMSEQLSYRALLETSQAVNWRIDDLVGGERRLDFSRPFLPETFARTAPLGFLSPGEKLALNHVRARGYLAMFELVEQFVVPFVAEQANAAHADEPFRAPALRQFVREENKHREMFRRVLADFDAEFGVECGLIGPAEDIRQAVLAHCDTAVAIAVLGLEWMSQGHYVEAVKDDAALDPQFKSLLEHHWQEEAQHARLDGLMLLEMAADDMERAIDEYFEIGALFDDGFRTQAGLDLDSFERAVARALSAEERAQFVAVQHQALRWTFLGSAMSNENFLAVLAALTPAGRDRVAAAAPGFC
jgi:N-acyl-D-aspartate/D-glutamate deacylase